MGAASGESDSRPPGRRASPTITRVRTALPPRWDAWSSQTDQPRYVPASTGTSRDGAYESPTALATSPHTFRRSRPQ